MMMSDERLLNMFSKELSTDGDLKAFLEQAGRGCVSGRVSDWPQLKPACEYAHTTIERLTAERDAAVEREGRLREGLSKIADAVRWGIEYRYIARDYLGDSEPRDFSEPAGMAFDADGNPVTDYGPEHDPQLKENSNGE